MNESVVSGSGSSVLIDRPKLLLVDDSAVNRLTVSSLLSDLDLSIVECTAGEESLIAVQREEFALILLDVMMPGMDGFETARRLRAEGYSQHTPIIFLTALDADPSFLDQGYAIGAVDFLTKPIRPIVLRSKVLALTDLFQEKKRAQHAAEQHRLLVDGTIDYAIFMLDPSGRIVTWNPGAERLKGYSAGEIIGSHFSRFYTEEDIRRAWPQYELKVAAEVGRFEDEGWRVRKDGSRFWANVIITALRGRQGRLTGFSKVTRDLTARKAAEEGARRLLEESTARRVAEENSKTIQEQAERLHVTLSSIGDAVISTDEHGHIQFVNPVAEELIGRSQSNAQGRFISDVFNIINESTRQPVENPALIALKEGRIVGLANHTILIAVDGKETYIDDSAAPIKTPDGKIIGTVLVFRDIGDKKRADRALRESNLRLRLAMTAGEMDIWDWELNDQEDSSSLPRPPMAAIDEFLGSRSLTLHSDDRQRVHDLIQLATRNDDGFDFEFRVVTQANQVRWFAVRGRILWEEDLPKGRIVGISTDITRRKRIEQTKEFLAEASATLAVLIDFESTLQKLTSLAVPFFADWATVDLLEADGSIRRVAIAHVDPVKNRRAHEFSRQYPQELNPTYGTGYIIHTGKPRLTRVVTSEMLDFAISNPEAREIVRKLGLKSYIGVPLKVRGKVLGVLSFFSAESGHEYDEMDLAAAQELADRGAVAIENARLYREVQEQDRRKDEFLATLAHELRNPLSPIRNSIQILKMPNLTQEIIGQTRDMMERQVNHLVRLVDDLLDVSRVMRGKIDLKRESVELSALIPRAIETVANLIEQQNLHLDCELTKESLLLNLDPVRMVQIISNLLANAAKYNNPGGHIWISTFREGDHAVLKIRDDGIGIAPDVLPHIFELFVQADQTSAKAQGGLGIGLTLVRNLVEKHGGTVHAVSAGVAQGSEFTVRLPLAAIVSSSTELKVTPKDVSIPVRPLKIIIVDDNRDAASSLGILLRLQGHKVHIANDGLSAIEIATKIVPDAVFLDIGMPGLDGYEVARRLRSLHGLEHVLLVALTGWGQEQDRRRSAEAGFDEHLVKPPDMAALHSLLATAVPTLDSGEADK